MSTTEPEADDPIALFAAWFGEAVAAEPDLPDAASLATVGADGAPSNRMVLVRRVTAEGFEFHTNYRSRKGRDLAGNRRAALAYHWKSLGRAVRVEGEVVRLEPAASDAYWATRPAGSRLSARASDQSEPIASREALQQKQADEARRTGEGPIARPDHWGGYRLVPLRIEFWTHRDSRLHDRIEYRRAAPGQPWERRRLQP